MNYKAIIFDLDGTLLDTLEDIAGSMNTVLNRFGFPGHPAEDYKMFIGEGMELLAGRALPETRRDPEFIKQCAKLVKDSYAVRCYEKTEPYDGITEVLGQCEKNNLKKAVLSNKPHEFTLDMVHHYFGNELFDIVMGLGAFPAKPDPSSALHIASLLDIPPREFIYVGDSGVDMKTAKASGMYAVGVLWGFRKETELLENGADTLVRTPAELSEALKKER